MIVKEWRGDNFPCEANHFQTSAEMKKLYAPTSPLNG